MDYAAARKIMVDSQVRVNDVTDRGLQAALLTVARERLLPTDRSFMAYAEVEPVIAGTRRLMLPRDVSKLLMAAEARVGETALAIAAPYAALVLAEMGLRVTAQDSDAEVVEMVSPALAEAGVRLVQANPDEPMEGSFDVIISEAAVPARPQAWIDQLALGGRLVLVERSGPTGKAVLYVRGEHGVSRRELFDAAPPVLAEMTPEPTFAF